ncbi:MAG: GH25 family lysozyme [Oscillospiraceae bacterium]|nr:GH25 family lysozyme [Oscillospiraceae bacterium]
MNDINGIDVGSYCNKINWEAVKSSGIEFAMIKATQGHSIKNSSLYMFTDSYFHYNLNECIKYNIPSGVYHYLTATNANEAIEEANYYLSVIMPYKNKIQLWAAVDIEDIDPPKYCGTLDKQTLTETAVAFLEYIRTAGFMPMLYANPNYLKYKYISEKAFSDYDIWLAHYGVKTPYQCNRMKIWQYGYTHVNGIEGDVDGDIGQFVLSDFIKPDEPVIDTSVEETQPMDNNVTLPEIHQPQNTALGNGLYTPPVDTGKGKRRNKKPLTEIK